MIPYILHVTLITTLCFCFYKLFLQKETFYRLNRWMLMGSLAVAFVLPLLPAPREWSWQGYTARQMAVDAQPQIRVPRPADQLAGQPAPVVEQDIPKLAQQKPQLKQATPKLRAAVPKLVATAPKLTAGRPSIDRQYRVPLPVLSVGVRVEKQASVAAPSSGIRPGEVVEMAVRWIFYAWLFGVLFFGFSFLLQLAVLLYQSYANPVIRDGRFRIVETEGNRAPCSFGNTIFINPANYDWETYNQILIHEKTHVSGRHTVDILLAELALVLQWFNPIVWLYRREVENNLEFLTDAAVLQHKEVERSAYQLSLLRVSAPHLPFSITNNYNQSLLKRRIVMMNSKRSPRHTVWKYFFLLPLFTALVCVLNKPAVYGQSSKPASARKKATSSASAPATSASPSSGAGSSSSSGSATGVGSSSAIAADPAVADTTTPRVNPVPAVSDIVAPVSEIIVAPVSDVEVVVAPAPVVAVSPKPVKVVVPIAPLPPVSVGNISLSNLDVNVNISMADLKDGSWFITNRTDDKLYFELKAEDEDHSWSHSFTLDKSEINPFPGSGSVTFKLVREAGTMTFTGSFDGQQGFGHFHFQADEGYFKALQQMGVEDLDGNRQASLFLGNVKKDYAAMVLRNGFPHISARYLVSFTALKIDQEYIQYWRSAGLAEIDEPRTMITLKAQNIDKSYVEELRAAGYDHLTVRELASLKAQHIDGAYARAVGRGKDDQMVPVRELVSYKAMKIDSNYVNSLRKLGYSNLERHEIISLYATQVTPEFIKSFQDLGYKEISSRDLISLKSQGITPEFIKGFKTIGIKELSPRELVQLKSMKITPEFIKGFKDIGYEDVNPNRLSSLKAMGITPEFVAEFKKLGFENIPLNMLPALKSTGVNAEYISKMREKGFVSKDLNKYIRLKNDFN